MRVLIVDDDALVAQSLSTILSVEDDVDVVGLGSSGPEAIERYRELAPDILLMDIQMPAGTDSVRPSASWPRTQERASSS